MNRPQIRLVLAAYLFAVVLAYGAVQCSPVVVP